MSPEAKLAAHSDGELAARIARDEQRASAEAELCRRFSQRVRAFGRRRLGDAAHADDFAQHVLVTVIESVRAGQLRDPDSLAAFVFGTCRMCMLEWSRARRRDQSLAQQLYQVSDATVEHAAVVDKERLARCLVELPMRDRMVVVLTFYAERDSDEIAAELALSAGNVRLIRHRALKRLEHCLDKGHGAA
jgi:RNA polymerase sigma-70 factor (ECF subfamily)